MHGRTATTLATRRGSKRCGRATSATTTSVRNAAAGEGRRPFWEARTTQFGFASALEVGCNVGGNLRWLAELLGPENVAGVDVNEQALEILRERCPGVDVRLAPARELPFEDGAFDLVFTTGVLIHQPPAELPP